MHPNRVRVVPMLDIYDVLTGRSQVVVNPFDTSGPSWAKASNRFERLIGA